MSSTLLPSIRSSIGDWVFYVTTLSLKNVNKLIKSPDEIHERKKLSEWIQREAIDSHASSIAQYIKENEQRFLGSLIIGVYGGNPDWVPLNVKFKENSLETDDQEKEAVKGKLGLLHFSGDEKLFAIDGQHRVAGIKKIIQDQEADENLLSDEVTAIFVSHDNTSEEGKQRTRRLFTTVNKKAKSVSKAATISLDEDNGFAIITRDLIDSHWLFEDDRNHISYTSSGAISSTQTTVITSVVGLYEIIKDLYSKTDKTKFEAERPSDETLAEHLNLCKSYLDILLDKSAEYKAVFVDKEFEANYYREDQNHILFRPIGQRAFARATNHLINSGHTMTTAIEQLIQANLMIDSSDWHYILWDPINNRMINKNLVLAESQLLRLSGSNARTTNNDDNLSIFLDSRDN